MWPMLVRGLAVRVPAMALAAFFVWACARVPAVVALGFRVLWGWPQCLRVAPER